MKLIPILIGLLALLASCGPLNSGTLPVSLQLGYDGKGSLTVYAANGAAWRVDVNSGWLEVSPQSGFGTATISLKSEPGLFPSGKLESQLIFSGDIKGTVKVIQPLMLLRGRLESAPSVKTPAEVPSLVAKAVASPETLQEILVHFRDRPSVPAGMKLKNFDRFSGWATLEVSNPQHSLTAIRNLPGVIGAEPNAYVSIQGQGSVVAQAAEPADAFYPAQWYLRSSGARFAHLSSYPNPVTVAVVDTGVRYDHPDLEGRLLGADQGAFDFVDSDSDPTDPDDLVLSRTSGSHGTHVSGIIAANAGVYPKPCPDCTDSGMVGLAYLAPVKILPLRVLAQTGRGSIDATAAAIRYAAGIPVVWNNQSLVNPNPVQIINLSLGIPSQSLALCQAVADVVAKGVAVIVAAGNYQTSSPGAYVYPAACEGAVAVAATDMDGKPAYYSQQNDRVTLAAPGGDSRKSDEAGNPLGILSTTYNYETGTPNHAYLNGTSQAAPQMAAAVALLLSAGKASTPDAAVAAIKAKLTDLGSVGRDEAYGFGFLNLPPVMGWSLPPGTVVGQLTGLMPQRLIPDAAGWFEAKAIAGRYRLQICRDDSANGLCDPGEPSQVRDLNLAPKATHDLGVLKLTAP